VLITEKQCAILLLVDATVALMMVLISSQLCKALVCKYCYAEKGESPCSAESVSNHTCREDKENIYCYVSVHLVCLLIISCFMYCIFIVLFLRSALFG
jgi:hypothetical protein